ncbi:hypothetical protein EH165_00110 [Nakamurella antarctica]|uniref:LPXTG-motif cell wall anchor domain-containing protein n=1 Tax=Nakamurella antarctica TaxID=1902245 RepID=A0A3G8ZSN9_9ACTN|nr:hypothetical protein [Nakamurella antarctica]AZI56811.1 hypothetical protein EH165_00110 [Nakamurella antarctica]
MSKIYRLLAAASIAVLAGLALVAPASATAPGDTITYEATMNPVELNTPAGAASGKVTVSITGDQVTVTEDVKGLADKLPADTAVLASLGIPAAFAGAAFPHLQHIHIDGMGQCPTAAADTDKNGVVDTVEGQPSYGKIGTTLSISGATDASTAADVTLVPGGANYTYKRTFTINAETLAAIKANKAVVVMHGLNPATAAPAALTAPNSLGVTLPGADKKVAMVATAPALCGVLKASQMVVTPVGAADTGGGSMAARSDNGLLFGLGAALIAGAGAILYTRKRSALQK